MEHFSGQLPEELEAQQERPRTVERLSNWVTGMEVGARRSPEASVDNDSRKEVDFETTKEAPRIPDAVLKGSMIAVGEVLADKTAKQADQSGVGSAATPSNSTGQSLKNQEDQATVPVVPPATGLTARQAIQLGALVGVCVAVLVLVWLVIR